MPSVAQHDLHVNAVYAFIKISQTVPIPKTVLYDDRISAKDLRVYAVLVDEGRYSPGGFIYRNRTERMARMSWAVLRQCLKNLADCGHIGLHKPKDGRQGYWLREILRDG